MSDNPSIDVAKAISDHNAELKRNPPAFPMTGEGCHDARYSQPGMTLRDYFAGQALVLDFGSGVTPAEQARHAYNVADAMLAARTGGA